MTHCPFCKGTPTVTRFSCGDEWNYQPSCPSCGAYIDKEYATYEEAESAWNHRPGEDAVAEECARIADELAAAIETAWCSDPDYGRKTAFEEIAAKIRSRFGGKA